jgi:hypothetical protein
LAPKLPAKIARKNCPQKFPAKFTRRNFPQKFPAKIARQIKKAFTTKQ